ncbi:hypothetical protein OCH239_16240 [Roseivivax halodurans JCM 10272]|uniref:Uncharacterized protein n=1 Tax=Roseivivax halodurans JCM 10272 TaxID=1449350 RepID=X7EHP9_9RHOB|nr:hypothetical protein [Roseivivax halodurans]ETX15375.1 hypothetical protein OCH239_16240 [Roseivivax halodurans JCM 10272]
MIVTVLATALMALSALMVVFNLRSMASDLSHSLGAYARLMTHGGRIVSRLAFGCLWLLIFGLSFA